MSHTYASILLHIVFSTKNRAPLISPTEGDRLNPYICAIGSDIGGEIICSNGPTDHLHLLLRWPPVDPIAVAVQKIKGNSSKWMNDTFPAQYPGRSFAWQRGYGVFSIGQSQAAATVAYIRRQREHHAKATFQEEYLQFLTRHNIRWDDAHVWG